MSFITNVAKDGGVDNFGVKRASSWHADETYDPPEKLPRLAILHAVEVPAEKGGTMFADMYSAYDTLAPAMKEKLAGDDRPARLYRRAGLAQDSTAESTSAAATKGGPSSLHPAVKEHPVTGRKVLFVNPTHCHGFVGMDEDEAIPLIEELRDHATQDASPTTIRGGSATW